jgi:hypothetical protein
MGNPLQKRFFAGEKKFTGNFPDNSLKYRKLQGLKMSAKTDGISFSGSRAAKVL